MVVRKRRQEEMIGLPLGLGEIFFVLFCFFFGVITLKLFARPRIYETEKGSGEGGRR